MGERGKRGRGDKGTRGQKLVVPSILLAGHIDSEHLVSNTRFYFSIPNAPCPMPNPPCLMPHAPCPMPNAQLPITFPHLLSKP